VVAQGTEKLTRIPELMFALLQSMSPPAYDSSGILSRFGSVPGLPLVAASLMPHSIICPRIFATTELAGEARFAFMHGCHMASQIFLIFEGFWAFRTAMLTRVVINVLSLAC
jgi:hypothetical protein